MKYTKIRVAFKEFPKRFYREMYVRSDLSLFKLGVCICCSLGAEFEHYFLFEDAERQYVPRDFEELWGNNVFMTKYNFKDIVLDKKNRFTLTYDTGEDYEFVITVLEKDVDLKRRKPAIILKGSGDRIWEDNISTLYAYLSGELDGELFENDEENGIYMPWNVYEGYKLKDFDRPFDVKADDYLIGEQVEYTIDELEENGVKY